MHIGHLVDAHATPDAPGGKRDRERAVRSGQHRRGQRARSPQQQAPREIVAEVVHLPDQRDGGAKYDRADAGGEIGEMIALGTIEQRSRPIGSDDTGKQDREPQRPRDDGPVGGDEREEGSGDQQSADDADDGRDGDAFRHRAQRRTNGVGGLRRQQAPRLPPRQIGLKPLPIGSLRHPPIPPLSLAAVILRQTAAESGKLNFS
jgi:hypothetical protein